MPAQTGRFGNQRPPRILNAVVPKVWSAKMIPKITFVNLSLSLCSLLAVFFAISGIWSNAVVAQDVANSSQAERETILVSGATGRLGRYLIQHLESDGYKVRGLTRDKRRAIERFGESVDWVEADVRDRGSMTAAFADVDRVISSVTASQVEGPNGPEFVDYEGNRNLIELAAENAVKQFVLVSSTGVGRRFHILNVTFNDILIWKGRAEDYLRNSGLNYTIVRPGGIRDGPGGEVGISIEQGDKVGGRSITTGDAAQLILALLDNPDVYGKTFEALNDETLEPDDWRSALDMLAPD